MTRILVVEDSPTQAEQLSEMLRAEGFEVHVASDGEQGFVRAATGSFDVVLSDVLMPGISGFDLCRRIKSNSTTKHLPVVLLTTLNDPASLIEAITCGADNFVAKPFEQDYLLARLTNVLTSRTRRQGKHVPAAAEVTFLGRRFTITADKEQLLDLLLSSFEDIVRTARDLEANQAALREAERGRREQMDRLSGTAREIDALASSAARDLNEPMRGLESFEQHLRDEYAPALDARGQRCLDVVCDSAIRMRKVIDALLALNGSGRSATTATQLH